jgi:RNA polymerase sigma factor (sigma-70 family)
MSKRTADISQAVRMLVIADAASLTDRDLLNRFVSDNDQAAFAALVRRHSAMVFGVCRRALGRLHDAEDACQAVFVLLARKAGAIRWRTSVANWLYATARNVAGNARTAATRRAKREGLAAVPEAGSREDELSARELRLALDEELDKLPHRYREPLVLCYLEGLTRDEAALRLGVPEATLKSQLERGRKKLAGALIGRGCTLGLSLLVTAATSSAEASSSKLFDSIFTAVSGTPSAAVTSLIQEVAMKGFLTNAKWAVSAVVAVAVCGVGLTVLYLSSAEPRKSDPNPSPDKRQEPAVNVAKGDDTPPAEILRTFAGKVVDRDGKPVDGAKIFFCFREREPIAIPVRATTDEKGQFTFTLTERDVPKTAVAIQLDGDLLVGGFVVAKVDGSTWAWQEIKKQPANVELTCVKDAAPLTGRVLDLQGKPIAGVRVIPLGAAAPIGDPAAFLKVIEKGELPGRNETNFWHDTSIRRRPNPLLPSTTTDVEGRFRLEGYAEDRLVELRLEGDAIETNVVCFLSGKHEKIQAPKRSSPDEGDGRMNAPRRLIVKVNGEDYVAAPGLVVTGTVRDAVNGKPIHGATIESYRLAGKGINQDVVFHTTTDAEGRYRLGGLPREHGSTIRIRGGTDLPYVPTMKEVPETQLFVPATLDVALVPGVWIDVTTIDRATGKPVPGSVAYFIKPKNNKDRVDREYVGAYDDAHIDNDGHFRFTAVADRAAVIGFRASAVKFAVAADAGRREPLGPAYSSPSNFHAIADVNPKAGAGPVEVDFILDSSRRVQGKVVGPDGEAISNSGGFGSGLLATGLTHDWFNQARPTQRNVTQKGDEFEVLGVEPGKPRLVCFLEPKLKLAGSVIIRGDEKAPIIVKLQPAASVKGRLLDVNGEPVKQAMLGFDELPPIRRGEARSTDTGPLLQFQISAIVGGAPVVTNAGNGARPITDDGGRFTIIGLVPGLKYNLVCRDRNKETADESVGWNGVVFHDIVFRPGETKDMGDLKVQAFPAR